MTRKRIVGILFFTLLLICPLSLLARDIAPFVSTDWLEKNLDNAKMHIIDIRKVEEFKAGHIPGAVNVFYGSWITKQGEIQNQLPADDDLADLINSAGIGKDSLVVIVGRADSPAELTSSTRVAFTLAYAGLSNIAILDGGYDKWAGEKRKVSQEAARPKPSDYRPAWNKNIVASKDDVLKNMKTAVLMDVRLPDFYFGVSKLPFVPKAGHIPGAVCLPTAWAYTKEGTLKPKDDLEAMAAGVIGKNRSAQIIVYCDTGKVCTAWWYLLTQLLGYTNVRDYDGSMEEWARDASAPVVKYTWK